MLALVRVCGKSLAIGNQSESQSVADNPDEKPFDPASLPLTNADQETYAFERALGYSMREACRRAGGKPENGTGTKWESSPKVIARIKYLRGLDDEMLREKRARIEERLNLAAFGNIFDFATIDETTKKPIIDWSKVKESDLAVIINEFAFDKDTGVLTRFKRDDALAAANQLRDMHGFKAPTKVAPTDKDGNNLTLEQLVAASMARKSEQAA
jgi:hypothetical protein